MDDKNTLYLECRSGISGDMTVAALLDLGATEENLRRTLAKLPVDGYEIKVQRLRKNGLDAVSYTHLGGSRAAESGRDRCGSDRYVYDSAAGYRAFESADPREKAGGYCREPRNHKRTGKRSGGSYSRGRLWCKA